jgi:FlaG/FlaF family flagellin (archaellin)
VFLEAVIGTFVLNLGQGINQSGPQASFGFDYDNSDGSVDITHETGDSITKTQLNATVSSGSWDPSTTFFKDHTGDDQISAGETVNYNLSSTSWSGQTVRVVWTSENGESSATLSQSTAP